MPPVRAAIRPESVEGLVALACRAPSVHNTQPWQFRYAEGSVELRVDPARRLRAADPSGRELLISCGAAVRNLELGFRRLGLEPQVRLLPAPNDPELLASVSGLPGEAPTRAERRLLKAIPNRHSHRGRFAGPPPSPALLADLCRAATTDGARLAIVPEGARAEAILRTAWAAAAEQRDYDDVQSEAGGWAARPGVQRRDGIPPQAYPHEVAAREAAALPGRDFALGRGWGTGDAAEPGGSVLALLLTDADTPEHWLCAGRALQHVLLRAATEWVFASFATQPLELPHTRTAVGQASLVPGFPQMLFRLGHTGVTAQTPRRPVAEVLTVDRSRRRTAERAQGSRCYSG